MISGLNKKAYYIVNRCQADICAKRERQARAAVFCCRYLSVSDGHVLNAGDILPIAAKRSKKHLFAPHLFICPENTPQI
ncbi:hypothetical protein BV914_05925 [Neisseria dumasiana]|uniref:Uncharacterized protein n=1 Tax=Neisseria dumasiana TaxID=1931275 RepID=A0ABX3WR21_9NEIS|nr:hypothetical protein BV914_05925 [Neisseria dumasiana]OSI37151.1 hypothetical protein BV913_00535 [Neisseria dumasiana]